MDPAQSPGDDPVDLADEIVAFLRRLPARVREEYTALAAADRAYGEDVERERREKPDAPAGPRGPAGGAS